METQHTLPQLFFILGRGRSGSWLLKSILSTHPEVSVAPESLFILHCYKRYHHIAEFGESQLSAFLRDAWSEGRIPIWWKLDKDKMRKKLMADGTGRSFPEVCKIMYESFSLLEQKQAKIAGDKNPTYTLFIGKLSTLFPLSKFIALVRDPRDNIVSFQQVGFDLKSVAGLALRWRTYNRQILEWKQKLNDRLMIIRYEDLLLSPEATLQQICTHLGIAFDRAMLRFYEYRHKTIYYSSKSTNPLDPSLAYKWKSKMNKRDALLTETICIEEMKAFGYETGLSIENNRTVEVLYTARLTAWLATAVERNIFNWPMKLRGTFLQYYRRRTGTLTEMED